MEAEVENADGQLRYEQLVSRRVRWTVREDVRDLFEGIGAVNWSKLSDEPGCELVKTGPHRSVVYLERSRLAPLPGAKLYVKTHHYPRLTDQLRYLFRRSRVETEWNMLLEAKRRGVPCVEPVAMGERRTCGFIAENYLVTASADGATELKEFLKKGLRTFPPGTRAQLLHRLARELGRFCARVHRAGIRQKDFHAGNILVKPTPDGVRLWLVDLHSATAGAPLGLGKCIDNLVSLNCDLATFVPRTARLRFFVEYARGHPFLSEHFGDYCRLIEQRSRRMHNAGLHRRDKRCLKNNRRFRRVRMHGRSGHCVRDVIKLPEKVLSAIPKKGMSQPTARLVKDSPTTTVWEQTLDFAGSRCTIFVKRYNRKKRLSPILDLVRHSRAQRGWRVGNALVNRCVPVARPLAVTEHRWLGFPTESWLITEGVADAETLTQFVAERLSDPSSARQRRRLAVALAGWVSRLHREGFSARDLKPNNLLVRIDEGRLEFVLVDFDGVVRVRTPSRRLRVRDIARLALGFVDEPNVRDVDRMRFLISYLGTAGRDRRVRRRWWGLIVRKSQAKRTAWKRKES